MGKNLKISVVIPIYKVEKYLSECVESVLAQDYENLEIILVDDGSPDHCPELCDEYHNRDQRVKVIHKANGGLSDARNTGVYHATGDYLLFLDGDDFWDSTHAALDLAVRVSQTNADVLNFSYMKFDEDSKEKVPYFSQAESMPPLQSREEQLRYLTEHSLYIASACNKLIRRSLFDEDLLFERGVFSEDVEWSARLLSKARSFDYIPGNFYCYRQRAGSISHSITEKNCVDLKNHILSCVSIAQSGDAATKEALYRFTAFQLGTYVKNQAFADEVPYDCIQELRQYTWLLRYHGGNRKVQALYLLSRILSFPAMCRLFRRIYK